MHAILGTVLIAASACFFGLAYYFVRRSRLTEGRFAEPIITLAAFVWTILAAFALVELSNFGLNWHTELAAVGPMTLAALGLVCLTAFTAANWLIRHASPTA